jgi:hypothetical protein
MRNIWRGEKDKATHPDELNPYRTYDKTSDALPVNVKDLKSLWPDKNKYKPKHFDLDKVKMIPAK